LDGATRLMTMICAELGIASPLANGAVPPRGVEVTKRGELIYLLNHNVEPSQVTLEGGGSDLLSGERFTGAIPLPARSVRILQS
jgi:beta-galactosidase